MINLLVSVAAFASVKLVFLWMFASERKRSDQVSQVNSEGPHLMESPDGRIQVSSLVSGNRLPQAAGLSWIDLSEPN